MGIIGSQKTTRIMSVNTAYHKCSMWMLSFNNNLFLCAIVSVWWQAAAISFVLLMVQWPLGFVCRFPPGLMPISVCPVILGLYFTKMSPLAGCRHYSDCLSDCPTPRSPQDHKLTRLSQMTKEKEVHSCLSCGKRRQWLVFAVAFQRNGSCRFPWELLLTHVWLHKSHQADVTLPHA